jgi:nitroimidazol reductase NimA-like FMN-containing flavoprotein (pyridoxamine 5'-phosphate oxidase superfamily)/ribosomal protein S18 acetylase RimI-like enzyme
MRKAECKWDDKKAAALLAEAPTVHLASTTSEGEPVLRALHAVCIDGLIAFHGAKAGESKSCLGRRAVVSAERVVASIPSYFVDPERACPATTYYESVQAKGELVEVIDIDEKAKILAAMMTKYQAEGGYAALEAANPIYKKELKGLLVYAVRIEEMTGKFNLGQRRKGKELAGIVDGLWQRGEPGDLEAVDKIALARPEESLSRLAGPAGSQLRCQFGERQITQVVDLLRGSYWNLNAGDHQIATAHRNSSAWVGALGEDDLVLGSGRALADGAKFAWILDVMVITQKQAQGIGTALMRMLLDHPKVRDCRSVGLVTRDAQDFYSKFGFEMVGRHSPSGHHQMLLQR